MLLQSLCVSVTFTGYRAQITTAKLQSIAEQVTHREQPRYGELYKIFCFVVELDGANNPTTANL